MPCIPVTFGSGAFGIVCTKGRAAQGKPCGWCERPGIRLCDFPVLPGRTCDKLVCAEHAHVLGPDKDLCPTHAPPRRRADHPFGTDIFAPLVPTQVPHGPGCPRCDAGLCHGCKVCRGERVHRLAARRLAGPWVAVIGARDHGNLSQLDSPIDALPPETVVVSGGARGVDGYGIARARGRGLRTVVLDADWSGGKTAGFARNGEVVTVVDAVVAATWWGCRGTLDTIAKAEALGLEVRRVKPSAGNLEVWTARLSSSCTDPDLFNITNMAARANNAALAPRWQGLPPAKRPRELVRELRRWEGGGLSLIELQRRARQEHAPSIGDIWAPSSKLLYPTLEALGALHARVEVADVAARAAEAAGDGAEARDNREAVLSEVRVETGKVWAAYAEAFMTSMRERFTRYPEAWGWLLGRRRVVLACTCGRPAYLDPAEPWARCHRFLVADALAKCGATPMGELPGVNPSDAQLALTY